MSHDDFAFEPVRGLPERPPEGERILWQGRPDSWALARESLNMYWIAAYFLVLAAWRFGTMLDQPQAAHAFASALPFVTLGASQMIVTAFSAAFPFVVIGAFVCALLWLIAFIQARATVYTITNRRVAMRIGAALTLTLNLPFTRIASADLDRRSGGTGTIALDTTGSTRFSYLVCWPHVRPWHLRETVPALRCIPDAERVARILAEAAEARVSIPKLERMAPQAAVAAE